jgi:nucleotide-binding universal stress UspA family protein
LAYVRALTALSPPPELVFLHVMAQRSVSQREATDEQMRRLGELRQAVSSDLASSRCCIRRGEPLDEILIHAAEIRADAILLGHHRERRGRRSLARRFAAAAPCAVWMVPDGSVPRLGRALAAFDLSPASAEAIRAAAAVARAAGVVELALLHVRQSPARYSEADFQRFVSTLDLNPLRPRLLVEDAKVAGRAIVQAAARIDADLVVMGARGQNPSRTVLLGSETEQTLRESAVPVLVVKAATDGAVPLDALLADQACAGRS